MSGVFWVVSIIMTVLAFAFLAKPLIESDRRKTVVALAIALSLFSAGLYFLVGSPQVESGRSLPIAGRVTPAENRSAVTRDKVGSVSSMVEGLVARLEENPEDGKGWLLLARSYEHLNQTEDATHAYSKAASLGAVDPEHAALGTTKGKADASLVYISGNLGLSANAAKIVLPTDTVFIFARGTNASGVPAAVLQRPAADLPMDFLLNDSQSMVEGIKLSDFNEVVVTARISRSGIATEALQGLEAKSDLVTVADSKHITLIIE